MGGFHGQKHRQIGSTGTAPVPNHFNTPPSSNNSGASTPRSPGAKSTDSNNSNGSQRSNDSKRTLFVYHSIPLVLSE